MALYLIGALARIEAEVEKLAVEATVRNMNSGLRLAQAELITQGRENERAALALHNPVDWLASPPVDYAGEADAVDPARLAAGSWAWERRSRTLYYRPRRSTGLRVDGAGESLGWHVVAAGGGVTAGRPGMLRLEAVRVYEWRP